MANEKTPLLQPDKAAVVVNMPADKLVDYEINNNEITTSLTYEELLPYIIDPSWMHLRRICSTACLIAFVVILLAACISAHSSMKLSCGLSLTKGDIIQFGIMTETSKGVISTIIDGFNSTVPQ